MPRAARVVLLRARKGLQKVGGASKTLTGTKNEADSPGFTTLGVHGWERERVRRVHLRCLASACVVPRAKRAKEVFAPAIRLLHNVMGLV